MTDHKKTWDVFANEIFVSTYMYKIKDDVLLHGKQCDPKQSQNHQLDWADFTQNCPVGNQAAGHAEVRIDQAGKMHQYNLTRRTMESRCHFHSLAHWPLHSWATITVIWSEPLLWTGISWMLDFNFFLFVFPTEPCGCVIIFWFLRTRSSLLLN